MSLLTRDELRALTQRRKGPCVSIFMPTYQGSAGAQQNPIRFNNLLREAEQRLLERMRDSEAEDLLEPAQRLLQNRLFWSHESHGLAVFRSPEVFRYYGLPFDFEQLVVVTHRFHIKPLLPLLSGDGRFCVLALSQNEVRLLQGTHYSVSELDLDGVPESLAQALKYDDPEKQLQFHTWALAGTGKRAAMFHGHGVGTDDTKENILRYFRQIDKGLHELLRKERTPLVLAGVEYLLPIYREANTYPYLVEEGITGNPEALSAEELHEQAWAIVQPLFLKAQEEAVAQYKQLADTDRASNDLKQVVAAAYYKRVETLFVALGLHQWGTFDPDTGLVRLHQQAAPDDEDLLDFAAVHTLLNGGMVYAVEPAKVPSNGPVAAVFRY